MTEYVPAALRRLVRGRSNGRCEYCLLPDEERSFPHEPDHIISTKHGGETSAKNLAWACFVCKRYKGSDLASVDPHSRQISRLFNPREDDWRTHFRYDDGRIVGLTPEGRATVNLLRFNFQESVEERRELRADGRWQED